MAYSIHSHKNRKYKPLTKKCMEGMITFYNYLEKLFSNKRSWDLEQLSPALEQFGDCLGMALNPRGDSSLAYYFVNKKNYKRSGSGTLEICPSSFPITEDEIKAIYRIISRLKEGTSNCENDKTGKHFQFLGEKRYVSSSFAIDLDRATEEELNKLEGLTELPSVYFEKSAINSIRNQSDDFNTDEEVDIITTTNFSYILIPASPLGYDLLQAFHIRPEKLKKYIKLEKYEAQLKWEVPSIYNENFTFLSQVLLSLLIQYYVSFGSFKDITTCRFCGKLTFTNQKEENVCGSPTCRWELWRENNPRDYETTKCRSKQNKWVKENTGETNLGKSPDFCVDCELKKFPPGGLCPGIVGVYDELIAIHKKEKEKDKEVKQSFKVQGTTHLDRTNTSAPQKVLK